MIQLSIAFFDSDQNIFCKIGFSALVILANQFIVKLLLKFASHNTHNLFFTLLDYLRFYTQLHFNKI